MTYSYNVNSDNIVEILKDDVVVDNVGPWDSSEGADAWGAAVCEKYNSKDYAGIDYPNEIEESK